MLASQETGRNKYRLKPLPRRHALMCKRVTGLENANKLASAFSRMPDATGCKFYRRFSIFRRMLMLSPTLLERKSQNLLLAMLPDEDYRALTPHLELAPTPFNFVLFERDKPIEFAYFPCSGEHSILAIMENGAAVEVGTVGYEGFSTIDLLLGSEIATETTVCQIPGESLRMRTAKFLEAVRGDTPLRRIALRYLQAYLAMITQSVACNRMHSLDERFARWVLMSHDRVKKNEFQLTQEYLAIMLGVHRPSVSVVAKTFQRAGLITYNRGILTILDRAGMEESCCECYGIVKKQFERSLGVGMG
jgi:CRP-like cAMP-binding protein